MRQLLILTLTVVVWAGCQASDEPSYLDHQLYRSDVSHTVRSVQLALEDLGLGVLGADEAAGVVVSKGGKTRPEDVQVLGRFDPAANVQYFLVVFVTPRGPDSTEVNVTTILRVTSPEKGSVGGGAYVRPSPLSEKLYDALDSHLGPGQLRPL